MGTGAICQIGLMKGIRIADISIERVVRAFELCGHHREDEQGLIAEYYDRYTGLGFEVIAVGKAPSSIGLFDRYATPDSVAENAKRLGVNPRFLVTFRDATKTMIEMACISNYTGLIPDIRGMHGPVAGVNEISKLFRPKSEGGILNHRGVVDYARPLKHSDGSIDFDRSVTPGVFLCVYRRHFDHPVEST